MLKGFFITVAIGIGWLSGWVLGWNKLTLPFDVASTSLPVPNYPDLAAPDDGQRRLAVLQHGVGRSAWSMWRLERLLETHGFAVLNQTYDCYHRTLAELGEDLEAAIDAEIRRRGWLDDEVELYGVAHSMGGLVLRSYLGRDGVRPMRAVVCLGTPHQGAVLAEQLHEKWFYRLFLGEAAAAELAPSVGAIARLAKPANVGNVFGGLDDGEGFQSRIPGDDDHKVGVLEARLEGELDAIRLPLRHTWLPTADEPLRQALHFLRHRRFAHDS